MESKSAQQYDAGTGDASGNEKVYPLLINDEASILKLNNYTF